MDNSLAPGMYVESIFLYNTVNSDTWTLTKNMEVYVYFGDVGRIFVIRKGGFLRKKLNFEIGDIVCSYGVSENARRPRNRLYQYGR